MAGKLQRFVMGQLQAGPGSAQDIANARWQAPTRSNLVSIRRAMHMLAARNDIQIGWVRIEQLYWRDPPSRRVLTGWLVCHEPPSTEDQLPMGMGVVEDAILSVLGRVEDDDDVILQHDRERQGKVSGLSYAAVVSRVCNDLRAKARQGTIQTAISRAVRRLAESGSLSIDTDAGRVVWIEKCCPVS